jgi:flagellar biosynthetic protein FliR
MTTPLDQLGDFLAANGRPALQTGALLLVRILPIVVFTPLFGGDATPRRMRVGIGILLTLALLPAFGPPFPPIGDTASVVVLGLKEAFVGFTIALCVTVLFETFAALGQFVDLARGATMANVFDPLAQNQESTLSFFFMQLAIAVFFAVNGHHMLLNALGDSFVAIPVYQTLPHHLLGPVNALALVRLASDLFSTAFRLAAPVYAVLLLLDIALGMINRVAPQIQVFFLSLTIKGGLGLFIVLLGLATLINRDFFALLSLFRKWLSLLV